MKPHLFCIPEMTEEARENIIGTVIVVNPKDYWEEQHCLADWTSDEVINAISSLGYDAGEFMEGYIEVTVKDESSFDMLALLSKPLDMLTDEEKKIAESMADGSYWGDRPDPEKLRTDILGHPMFEEDSEFTEFIGPLEI